MLNILKSIYDFYDLQSLSGTQCCSTWPWLCVLCLSMLVETLFSLVHSPMKFPYQLLAHTFPTTWNSLCRLRQLVGMFSEMKGERRNCDGEMFRAMRSFISRGQLAVPDSKEVSNWHKAFKFRNGNAPWISFSSLATCFLSKGRSLLQRSL